MSHFLFPLLFCYFLFFPSPSFFPCLFFPPPLLWFFQLGEKKSKSKEVKKLPKKGRKKNGANNKNQPSFGGGSLFPEMAHSNVIFENFNGDFSGGGGLSSTGKRKD